MNEYCELGIDEAGRGPVLGPMVLAGVVVPISRKKLLEDWGVADSKSFGSSQRAKQKREALSAEIMRLFEHEVVVIPSATVDQYVQNSSLNHLEQTVARQIIQNLKADRVILDGKSLFSPLEGNGIEAVNKADCKYVSVAAASILAKVERDRQFSLLCEPFGDTYGDVQGGGYANKKTLEFVRWYITTNGHLPAFYRASYKWKEL